MKVAIVGSRRYKDRKFVEWVVRVLPEKTIVVSGGCYGVDTWAIREAKKRGLETIEILPNLVGKTKKWQVARAYYKRNQKIAKVADQMLAFVAEDRKGGTENAIKHMKQLGKKVRITEP